MTSWIATSTPKKKVAPAPLSVSYFQMNGGTFKPKTEDPTIVTVLYDTPYQTTVSKDAVKNLLQTVSCPVILFTEKKFSEELALACEDLEDKTRIIVLEPSEWIANVKTVPTLWTQQVKQDPEVRLGRTVEQFQLGFEKKEFMMKAVNMNPFETADFVWIDPVFFETEVSLPVSFPAASRIPTDRIVVYNPEPFTADDIASSYFRGKKRIDNAILAGSASMWNEYAKLYTVVMGQKLRLGGFVGDDLINLHYMIIHKPNQFCLVNKPLYESLVN